MRPELFALITAMAWGIGGYFEKKGLLLGNLSPQVGITLRTFVAFIILGALSMSQWKTLATAGTKSLTIMVIGGGLVAGTIGMLCFYFAIKHGTLASVMPIAFTSPLFGAMMPVVMGETSWREIPLKVVVGMVLCVLGIALITTK